MADLYITEYAEVYIGLQNRTAWFPMEPPLVDGNPISIGASATVYGPLNEQTTAVRLFAGAACSFLFSFDGQNATKNSQPMAANTELYRGVRRGSFLYISVIEGGSAPVPSHDAQPLGMP